MSDIDNGICTKCDLPVMSDSVIEGDAPDDVCVRSKSYCTNKHEHVNWRARHLRTVTRSSLDLVREFHETYGQPIAAKPSLENAALNKLRVDLLQEELSEFAVALHEGDAADVLDALVDLQYVLDGAFLSLGFAAMKDAALAEVHRSNMSKLGADGKPIYREDGKVLKGLNYTPPDLRSILERHLRKLT